MTIIKKVGLFVALFLSLLTLIVIAVSCGKVIYQETTTSSQEITEASSLYSITIASTETIETTAKESDASISTTTTTTTTTMYADEICPLTAENVVLFEGSKSGTIVISDKLTFVYTDGESTITGRYMCECIPTRNYLLYRFYSIKGADLPAHVYAYKVYETDNGYDFILVKKSDYYVRLDDELETINIATDSRADG